MKTIQFTTQYIIYNLTVAVSDEIKSTNVTSGGSALTIRHCSMVLFNVVQYIDTFIRLIVHLCTKYWHQ